ncbi:MAG: hypothetical protein ABIX01_16010 [Chitinophagaceae bacterium]
MKQENTVSRSLIFVLVTFVYLVTKWITFKGFSGTDDLHYANLASNMLKGTYTPFIKDDIFSGRIGLIGLQALVYAVGGISAFTTQINSLLLTILCCYLTLFKLGRLKYKGSLLVGTSLFYFNPVLNQATLGIMPDVYIMFTIIIVLILWKKNKTTISKRKFAGINLLIGAIILAALFFKESAIICIPFLICLGIYQRKQNGIKAAVIVTGSFTIGVLLCGLFYYRYTNDFFFKLHQIQNADYPNPCNYAPLPSREMLTRLTYGVWREFITVGFFPVMLAAMLIACSFFYRKLLWQKLHLEIACFIILTILGLYLPFSVKRYQPLCHNARHFIFLYPFAVIIVAKFVTKAFEPNGLMLKYMSVSSLVILAVSFTTTGNKWMWMMYGLFSTYFIFLLLVRKGIGLQVKYVSFGVLVWLFMPYKLFFQSSSWYKDSCRLSQQVTGNYFYFPEHVNMMTWKFIHGFNAVNHYYNMEPTPFKIFVPYYEKQDSIFHAGWFVVNNAFTDRTPNYLKAIKEFGNGTYFLDQNKVGDMTAYYLKDISQYRYIDSLTAVDYKTINPCCN